MFTGVSSILTLYVVIVTMTVVLGRCHDQPLDSLGKPAQRRPDIVLRTMHMSRLTCSNCSTFISFSVGPERVTVSGTEEARGGDTVHMSCISCNIFLPFQSVLSG